MVQVLLYCSFMLNNVTLTLTHISLKRPIIVNIIVDIGKQLDINISQVLMTFFFSIFKVEHNT